MNKRQSWNIITLFCILIFGFTIATMIKPDTEYSESENRTLAKMPELTAESVLSGEFEADYETYLTDQFVARDAWIGLKTDVERAMFKRESKDIYFADDGYLIEKHTGAFTTDTAALNVRVLGEFARMYQEQFQDHMTVMVVPNAVDILKDKLPPFASPYDEEAYLTQIEQALPEGVWFDTSDILRAHSDEEIYYRTDHHWETLAAFYVYQQWAKQQGFAVPQASDYEIETVTEAFEGTVQSKLGIDAQKDSIEIYKQKEDIFYTVQKGDGGEIGYSVYDRTALETKSKYDIFFGGNHALVRIGTRAGKGRRLLVIKDSYAHCFVPFLLEEFDAIDMLDIRYYNQKVSELIAQGDYTDLLFLYNASGFAEDTSISRLTY
ncbi:MAG: DHHW family protein [Lachnospiraceae bacterium]|uniref:DHHW family protein n=1 Tax=Parablautia sp. Marseille-Q6255 TaxID=3039593 RepID=UPI0024BCABC3|nr:DHHW family protein [Parablautia sp. Marseille-Q6255]